MNIELINTGSELMLGRVLNTHQQWICAQLAQAGMVVSRQTSISDTGTLIETVVREALTRADVVITTGGLGPTSDDLTRDRIAALLGRRLLEDATVLAKLGDFYHKLNRTMPPTTRVQAQVPEGALVLPNAHGTAPGLAIELTPNPFHTRPEPGLLIMLPGPPRELKPMFTQQVLPLLIQRFPVLEPYVSHTLKTACLGESVIEERIAPALQALVQTGLEIGYCARLGEVEIRLEAHGIKAQEITREACVIVESILGPAIFGGANDNLEAVIIKQLTQKNRTVATAESCTGGLIAHRLTNVSGASAVFNSGLVTYSNAAKEQLLGVRAATLEAFGAVSEATAREMAEGARTRLGTDYAVAVTGIAGPTGGTPDKPVGTVFIGLATPDKTSVGRYYYPYDRESFKIAVSQQALDLLRRALVAIP